MLSEGQFGDLRMHGDKYVLHNTGRRLVHAYPAVRGANGELVHPTQTNKKPVGSVTWFSGKPTEQDLTSPSNTTPGSIHKIIVKPAHQNKGIGTAMVRYAQDTHPDSKVRMPYNALSDAGKAFKKKIG